MCHGLRAYVRFRPIIQSFAALACLFGAWSTEDAHAQTTRTMGGAGAPAVVPPRSTLRIGDSKRPTTTTQPTANPSIDGAATVNNGATSGASSAAENYSVGGNQGSQLQIRVPAPTAPTYASPTQSQPVVASPLQPRSQLQLQPRSEPTLAVPATGTPTLVPPRPSALNPTTSNPPVAKEELPPIAPFAFAPSVTNPKPEASEPTSRYPTGPTVAPAVRGPTFTASTAPLAAPTMPAPSASSPYSPTTTSATPSLPTIQPPLEPSITAAPPRTSLPSLATTPITAAPNTDSPIPATPLPIPPPVATSTSSSPAPTTTKPTSSTTPPSFAPPPTEPVDFAPTRTITRTPGITAPNPTTSTTPAPATGVPAIVPLSESAGVPLAAAVPADPTATDALPKLEPVDFNGVLLGESTVDEVVKAWGQPVRRSGSGNDLKLSYKIEPFDSIDVTFFDTKAEAIVIELGEKFPPADIVKELSLNESEAVPVEDPSGNPLGLVFPERGVSLRFEESDKGPLVATIGLDRISARPFVLRAEKQIDSSYSAALTDLALALSLDSQNSRAYWLRAKLLHKVGRTRGAMEAIEAALKIDPKAADYLLTRAEFLADEGLGDAARADNDTVLEGTKSLPLYQARAWCQRGDLLAGGPQPNFSEAIDAHTRAVRLAEPLATDKTRSLRRGAKRVLVEAHLAIAQDVAWGEWQDKAATSERWLKKAEGIALEAKASGDLGGDELMDVYVVAATVGVGTQGQGDPLAWATGLKRTADELLAGCDDPLRRKQIQFDAGLGLYDALQALHAKGDVDNALKYGTEAVEWIQQGRVGREESPIDAYRFGRLYFRIGSLYAVKRNDHAKAVEWFARAAPLLERPLSEIAAADRGRQGETLVSMGISYWATGNRERALQLTNVGASYMQQAVRDGTLAGPAMGVAYSNLATMHKQLGDEPTSKKFVEMATRVEAPADGVLRR
jgi:tetratricopeptide (TPR) repeat protein